MVRILGGFFITNLDAYAVFALGYVCEAGSAEDVSRMPKGVAVVETG